MSGVETDLSAIEHGKSIAGETAAQTITAIGIDRCGITIDACDSATGVTGGTLDTALFREGTASLYGTAALSSTQDMYHEDAIAATDFSAMTHIELWLRVDYRARVNLASSTVQIYSGGTTADRFDCTYADIETARGIAFQDGQFTLCRIPKASFTVGAGSPSWATVTGWGRHLAATAVGATTGYVDFVKGWAAPDMTSADSSTTNEVSRHTITMAERDGSSVLVRALWLEAEAVGWHYLVRVYAGSTPIGLVPFLPGDTTGTVGAYKQAGKTLTVTVPLIASGG